MQDPEIMKKLSEMEELIQRILGMLGPIKKSVANCYVDSPFIGNIILVEMTHKFNFLNMKMFDKTTDLDDHVAQY